MLSPVVLLAVSVAGCNFESANTAPVSGTVPMDGQPISGGWVRFLPQQGGRGAAGQIQSGGSYQLQTSAGETGVPRGTYSVTVVAYQGGEGEPAGQSAVPQRYGSTATSGLSYEVVAGQVNTFDIRLTSQATQP